MRIGLAIHRIGSFGCAASVEARYCQIEAAPEEVDRAGLPDEPAAKLLKHAVDLPQDVPPAVRPLGIVGCVLAILVETNR